MINISAGWAVLIGVIALWVPKIIQLVVILIVGWIIAMIIRKIVQAALHGIQLNKRIEERSGGWFHKLSQDPTKLLGNIAYWIIWVFTITIAIPILNISFLNQLVYGFYAYIPNIIAAILIFIIAALLSTGVGVIVSRIMGDTPTGRITRAILPTLIMTLAAFMILVQLKIAVPIVIITYAALIGALALGFALAFGLGGREVAGRMLEDAYKKGQQHADQIKRDLQTASERGRKEAENFKNKYRKG